MDKYKLYISRTETIFWTKDSTDKPHRAYFSEILFNWQEVNNNINFSTFFNGTIVLPYNDVTYIKLEYYKDYKELSNDEQPEQETQTKQEPTEVKYFLIDGVEKILNNGVIYNVVLDVWTSYCIEFFNKFDIKNPIFIKKSNNLLYLRGPSKIIDNEYNFNYIPAYMGDYQEFSGLIENTLLSEELAKGYKKSYHISLTTEPGSLRTVEVSRYLNTNIFNWYCGIEPYIYKSSTNNNKVQYVLYFDVYQEENGTILYFPIISNEFKSNGDHPYLWFTHNGGKHTQVYNCLLLCDILKNSPYFIKKYLGRFYIPLWTTLIKNCFINLLELNIDQVIGNKIFEGISGRGGIIRNILFFSHNQGIVNIENTANVSKKYFSTFLDPLLYINDKKHNLYLPLIKELTQGKQRGIYYIDIDKDAINFSGRKSNDIVKNSIDFGSYYTFTPQGALFFNFADTYIKGFETVPVSTSEYAAYMAGIINSQNNSINIAQQQAILGFINNSLSLTGNLFNKNVLGSLGSLTGFASTYLQYDNKLSTIRASNEDKFRTSTANNIYPSSVINNSLNRFFISFEEYITSDNKIPIYQLDNLVYYNIVKDTQYYNALIDIYNNGFKVNNYISNTRIMDIDNYAFRILDAEIPKQLIKNVFKNANNELLEAIYTNLNQLIRAWNRKPIFSAPLLQSSYNSGEIGFFNIKNYGDSENIKNAVNYWLDNPEFNFNIAYSLKKGLGIDKDAKISTRELFLLIIQRFTIRNFGRPLNALGIIDNYFYNIFKKSEPIGRGQGQINQHFRNKMLDEIDRIKELANDNDGNNSNVFIILLAFEILINGISEIETARQILNKKSSFNSLDKQKQDTILLALILWFSPGEIEIFLNEKNEYLQYIEDWEQFANRLR